MDTRSQLQTPGVRYYDAPSDAGAEHWALMATLIASAKLNDVEPLAYLTDILERIVSGRTKATEIDRLLLWNWKVEREVDIRLSLLPA
jgi:hypothetical protein